MLRHAVLALIALTMLTGWVGCGQEELERRVAELEKGIAERLPPGSTVQEVEAFLRAKGLEPHSGPSRGGSSSIRRHDPSLADRTFYTTSAIIPDVYRGLVMRSSIVPRFYFDKDKRLLWSEVAVDSIAL